MSSWFCRKQERIIDSLERENTTLQLEISQLKSEVEKKEREVQLLKKKVEKYEHYSLLYKDMPSIDSLLKTGRAKLSSYADFERQFEQQFQLNLRTDCSNRDLGKTCCRWTKLDLADVRLNWRTVYEIVRKSPTSFFSYDKKYACSDFAVTLFSEFNLGIYWRAFVGVARIQSHRLNLVWFSDDDKIYYIEPQTGRIFLPTKDSDKMKPREIFI